MLDVVATDREGRTAETLTPADFAVLQRGVPQTIVSARLVREETRLFGIYLDEFHITPGLAAERVRDALATFVRQELTPLDRLVVLKPLDSLLSITLTADREAAAEAIESLAGREHDYVPRTAFERSFFAQHPARIAAARGQITVSALNALAVHLGTLGPGRKTLILVGGRVPQHLRVRGDAALPTIEGVARAANQGRVSIYTIEVTSGEDQGGEEERNVLRSLAATTGGRAISSSDAVEPALLRVAADSRSYYSIALSPDTEKPDGRFHPLDVKVARKGITVRSRAGYWATVPLSPPPTRSPAVLAFDRVPRRISPLIRPWFGMAPGVDGRTRVRFVWEPAPRAPGNPSTLPVPAQVTINVTASDGTPVFAGVVVPSRVSEQSGMPTKAQAVFEQPPGRLRVHMSIEDASSREIDTDVRDLTVGSFAAPLTLGTPEVLRVRNAREFRAIVNRADALSVPSRQFSRADRLLVRVPVYAVGPEPRVFARLVSNFGNAVRDLPLLDGPAADVRQVDLPLAGLAAGEYAVEFSAIGAEREVRESVAFRVVP